MEKIGIIIFYCVLIVEDTIISETLVKIKESVLNILEVIILKTLTVRKEDLLTVLKRVENLMISLNTNHAACDHGCLCYIRTV